MAAQRRRRAGCWDDKSLGASPDAGAAFGAQGPRDVIGTKTRDRAPLVKEGRCGDLGTHSRRAICRRRGQGCGREASGNGRRRGGQTAVTDDFTAWAVVDSGRITLTHTLNRNISRYCHQAPLLSSSGIRPSVRVLSCAPQKLLAQPTPCLYHHV